MTRKVIKYSIWVNYISIMSILDINLKMKNLQIITIILLIMIKIVTLT